MQNTSNYNLNIVEGTDIVNIPVQLNPNFQTIDSEMFKNKQGSTGTATEVVTGTVHAIVRANTDADVFRFTATGNWASGDTMTVDGSAVTVHLTDGTAPGAGAYVIGAEVVAVINGTLVTLISSSAAVDPGVTSFNSRTGAVTPTASDYDASMIDYDNTVSSLTATDVQSAIDEVAPGAIAAGSLAWLNNSFVFKYEGTTGGSLAFDPSTDHELLVCMASSSAELSNTYRMVVTYPKSILTEGKDIQLQAIGGGGVTLVVQFSYNNGIISLTGGSAYARFYVR